MLGLAGTCAWAEADRSADDNGGGSGVRVTRAIFVSIQCIKEPTILVTNSFTISANITGHQSL
jgi:hypothetical protein